MSEERERAILFRGVVIAGVGLLILSALTTERWIAWIAIPGTVWAATRAAGMDPVALRLFAYAALHGVVLLWWDWLLVRDTLAYPPDGPFIVRSPVYMPFAWTVTLAPVFILAVGRARRSIWPAIAAETVMYVACEVLAVRAGWWSYEGVPGIAGVPFGVVVAYPLFLTVSTQLAVRAASAGPSAFARATVTALVSTVATTTLTWAALIVPFRA